MEQLSTYFRICLGILLLFLFASCEGGDESPFEKRWPVQGGVGGQWGYIDASGNIAIPQQFDYATEFSEGFGGVNIGGTRYRNHFPTDGKWGFVDAYGRFLINPVYDSPPTYAKPYDLRDLSLAMHEGYIFSEGLAPVYKEGRWFYIGFLADKLKDTLYIASAWKKEEDNSIKTYPIRSARRFNEGLAAVYIDGAWGYINYWGEIIIEPQFVYPVEFYQGRILAMGKDLRQVIYNVKGERELPIYRIVSEFKDGLAVVKPKMLGQSIQDDDEIKYALIDTSGKFMFTAQFDKIGDFGSGLAPVLIGSNPDTLKYNPDKQIIGNRGPKWGYIDMFGHFVHNPVFQDAKGFVEGVAAVKRGEYWGYMEPDGTMLTEYEFLWAGNFKNGMTQVRLGPTHNDYAGLFAYMNLDGDIIYIQEN
ncbi:MAG: WG repeat-containing protein [Bacteroidota bacterium]